MHETIGKWKNPKKPIGQRNESAKPSIYDMVDGAPMTVVWVRWLNILMRAAICIAYGNANETVSIYIFCINHVFASIPTT